MYMKAKVVFTNEDSIFSIVERLKSNPYIAFKIHVFLSLYIFIKESCFFFFFPLNNQCCSSATNCFSDVKHTSNKQNGIIQTIFPIIYLRNGSKKIFFMTLFSAIEGLIFRSAMFSEFYFPLNPTLKPHKKYIYMQKKNKWHFYKPEFSICEI